MKKQKNYALGLTLIEKGGSLINSSLSYCSEESEILLDILNDRDDTNAAFQSIFIHSFDEEVAEFSALLDDYLEQNNYIETPCLPKDVQILLDKIDKSQDRYQECSYGIYIYSLGLKLLKELDFSKEHLGNGFEKEYKDNPIIRFEIGMYYEKFEKLKNAYLQDLKDEIGIEKVDEILHL